MKQRKIILFILGIGLALLLVGTEPFEMKPHVVSGASPDTQLANNCGTDPRIRAYPTGSKIIIIASSIWNNGCAPQYDYYVVNGKQIDVWASPKDSPSIRYFMVLSPWEFPVLVNNLAEGLYTIRLNIINRPHTQIPEVCSTSQVAVRWPHTYLPWMKNN